MGFKLLSTRRLISFVLVIVSLSPAVVQTSTPSLDQEGSGLERVLGSGLGEPGSGFGSGSGFGDEIIVEPTDCTPLDGEGSSFVSNSEDNAILEGRCRSTCLNEVLDGNEDLLNSLINRDDVYPTVSSESLGTECAIYQKVYECTVGCQMGSSGQSCSSDCFDVCSERLTTVLPGSSCPISCNRTICNRGCALYGELDNTGSLPTNLSSSLSFSLQQYSSPYFHHPAAYTITVTDPFSSPLAAEPITSFVVKVSSDELVTHYWLPSFDSLLFLDEYFGCKTVTVVIIPVNKNGSMKTNPFTLIVKLGEVKSYPDHPDPRHTKFTNIVSDDRDGYWHHVSVDITWSNPNRFEFLTDFTISVSSEDEFNCGKSQDFTGITKPMYTWRADFPANGPLNGCTYRVQILSNPHSSTYPGDPESSSLTVNIVTNPPPENVTFPVVIKCGLDDFLGDFMCFHPRMTWILPSNPALLQGIKEFHLDLTVLMSNNNGSTIADVWRNETSVFNGYNNSRSQLVPFNISYKALLQQLTIVYEPGYTQYLNTSFSCLHRLVDPPTVTNIFAHDIYIDQAKNRFYVNISWQEPMFSEGRVINYNVFIGRSIQYEHSVPPDNEIHAVKSALSYDEVMTFTDLAEMNKGVWYIQVQSISNVGLKSVWSDPYIFDPKTSEFHINLDMNCYRTVQDFGLAHQKFVLRINWNVTSPKLEGLKNFKVNISEVHRDGTISPEQHLNTGFSELERHFEATYHKIVSSKSTIDYFLIEVQTNFKNRYPNRRAVVPQTCIIKGDLEPPPDIPPESMSMELFEIDAHGRLNISLTWMEPAKAINGIREYWVYIGTRKLSGSADPVDAIHWEERLLDPEFKPINKPIGKSLLDHFGNDSAEYWEMYIQVMPISNADRRGNWSTAFHQRVKAFEVDLSIFEITITTTIPMTTTTNPVPSVSTTTTIKKPVSTINAYHRLVPVISAIIPVIFVLLLAIILVAIFVVVAYCQRRKMAAMSSSKHDKPVPLMAGIYNSMDAGYIWEKDPRDIEKLSKIGDGTFGEVYHGILHQLPDTKEKKFDDSIPVFITSLKVSSSEDERYGFVNLLEKYKQLSSTEHPFFLSFQGCVTSSQPWYLITEYAENGDLLQFLQSHKKKLLEGPSQKSVPDFQHQHPTHDVLYPVDLLNFARQIASAMDCLAGNRIIHGDLACRNIYIDQNFNLKVADFGVVGSHREMVYVKGLPIRWMSPEALHNHFSTAGDVWAYGVTLWEIITLGQFPYQEIRNEDLLQVLLDGKRLPKPANCSLEFFSIICSCWESNPRQRPKFELLNDLFLNQLSKNEASSLFTMNLVPDQPHPSASSPPTNPRTTILQGSISPISGDSADSAISDDLGVTILPKKEGTIVAVTNPGYRKDSVSFTGTGRQQESSQSSVHKGFKNPMFRKSSMKSINLDSPSIQVSTRVDPPPPITSQSVTKPSQNDPTIPPTSADTENISAKDTTSIDTATEV